MSGNRQLIFLLFYFCAGQSSGAEKWDILVIGLADQTTLPADHVAYDSASQAIRRMLTNEGYRVEVTERNFGLDCTVLNCADIKFQDVLPGVRESHATTDAILFFWVKIYERRTAAYLRQHVSVTAEFVLLKSGRSLRSWSGTGREYKDVPKAETELQNWQAQRAMEQALGVGSIMTELLGDRPIPQEYFFSLVDFEVQELNDFEQFMVQRDFEIEPTRTFEERAQLLHFIGTRQFRIVTTTDNVKFQEILREVLAKTGAGGAIYRPDAEGRFALVRSHMPYLYLYILALVMLVAFVVYSATSLRYKQHQRRLSLIYQGNHTGQGLDYLSAIKFLPRKPQWQEWQEEWLEEEKRSDNFMRDASQAKEEHDYEKAINSVSLALKANNDNLKAQKLRDDLPAWKRGHDLFKIAESELHDDPSSAAKRMLEVLQLNPHLDKEVRELEEKARQAHRQGGLRDVHNAAQQLLGAKRIYPAIAKLDEGLDSLEGLTGFASEKDRFLRLRELAVSQITPIEGNFIGQKDLAQLQFHIEDEVMISRKSTGKPTPGIAIGFRRLSGYGRQSRLYRAGDRYVLQDKGSANGTIVDGRSLASGETLSIAEKTKIGLGGNKEQGIAGSCLLQLIPAMYSRNSLVVQFDNETMTLLERSGMGDAWPSIEEDLATRWVLMGESIGCGIHNGRLDVGCLLGSEPVFRLYFDGSLAIEPEVVGPASILKVDGCRVMDRLPLAAGVLVEVEGLSFSFATGERVV